MLSQGKADVCETPLTPRHPLDTVPQCAAHTEGITKASWGRGSSPLPFGVPAPWREAIAPVPLSMGQGLAGAALSDPLLWLLCRWVSKVTVFVPNTTLPCYPQPPWLRGSRRGRTRDYSLWRTVEDLITGQLALGHHPPPPSTPRSRLGTGIYGDQAVSGTTSELCTEGG